MASTAVHDGTTYDVDVAATTPAYDALPGVARVAEAGATVDEAVSYDTAGLALAGAGIALRRRAGGDDEGWLLELPDGDVVREVRVPLSRSARQVPAALRRVVAGVAGGASLEPVLVTVTEHRVHELRDATDRLLAVVHDDRVRAARPGTGEEEALAWRAWRVACPEAPKKLRKRLGAAFEQAGAAPATHPSDLARALALPPTPAPPEPLARTTRKTTEQELVQSHLTALVHTVRTLDPLVRADVPDAVHRMRTTCRRLRAVTVAFERRLEPSAAEGVAEGVAELRWLGEVLGRARDLEVLVDRVDAMLADLPPEMHRHRPGGWVRARLRQAHREAHRDAVAEMSTERYAALLAALDGWSGSAPWRRGKKRLAREHAGRALDRRWRRLERAARAAAVAGTEAERETRLHDVRKAAKGARYAADVVRAADEERAERLGGPAKAVQAVLGDHRDAVVAAQVLLELADLARERDEDAFGLGLLYARCLEAAAVSERDYEQLWSAQAP